MICGAVNCRLKLSPGITHLRKGSGGLLNGGASKQAKAVLI